ncbi:MAG: hypothetical protein IIC08_06480 [Proteobacteria bacterium]|nr:hypothetical protein [Pseudomonadota bacterium]
MRIFVIVFAVITGFSNSHFAVGQSSDTLFEAEKSPGFVTLFIRTDSGQPVPPAMLDPALSESSVIGRLAGGETARFLGVTVESSTDSMVLLGASADVVYAACLKGSIQAGDAVANPGQLIMWQPGVAAPVSYDFDMRRYLASSSLRFNPDIQAELEQTVSDQEEQMFWGALQRTSTNVQSLSSPITEQMRREYLRRPAVIRLRLKNSTIGGLARGVAETFAAALAACAFYTDKHIDSREVYAAATKRDQAGRIFSKIEAMVKKSPALRSIFSSEIPCPLSTE